MSGVNAHGIIQTVEPATQHAEAAGPAPATCWQRSMRCFVDVLVALHPLLGAATKVSRAMALNQVCSRCTGHCLLCRPHLHARQWACSACCAVPLLQAKQLLQFKLALGRPTLAFFWDHQVQGAAIMPGAAYFELATAAAHTLLRLAAPSVALTGASIAAPLKLPPASEAAATVLSAEVALVAGEISIRSGSAGGTAPKGAGTLHLKGSMALVAVTPAAPAEGSGLPGPAARTGALSADAARAACPDPLATAGVYGKLVTAGLEYGPEFRWVPRV